MFGISGFIDLQVNGFIGVDFSSADLTAQDFRKACRALYAKGTVAFLPTVITSSQDRFKRNLAIIAKEMSSDEFKNMLLGIHLEGPFLSDKPGAVGAHNPDWIQKPSIESFKQLQDWADGNIRLLTIAAESEGAEELAGYAVKNGVTVSLGHHLANYGDIKRLADAGATLLTHLGNGVPNIVPRHDNPIWAGLAEDRLSAMVISDGHHLPENILRVMLKVKGTKKTIITSDASPIAGMPPGKYETLGNVAVLEESGLLHNPEKQCLVGSSATMLECVNYMLSRNIIAIEDVIDMSYNNPLRAIGINSDEITTDKKVEFVNTENSFVIV